MLQKMPDVCIAYIAYIGIIIPKLYFRSIGSLQNTVGSFSVGQVSDPMSQPPPAHANTRLILLLT